VGDSVFVHAGLVSEHLAYMQRWLHQPSEVQCSSLSLLLLLKELLLNLILLLCCRDAGGASWDAGILTPVSSRACAQGGCGGGSGGGEREMANALWAAAEAEAAAGAANRQSNRGVAALAALNFLSHSWTHGAGALFDAPGILLSSGGDGGVGGLSANCDLNHDALRAAMRAMTASVTASGGLKGSTKGSAAAPLLLTHGQGPVWLRALSSPRDRPLVGRFAARCVYRAHGTFHTAGGVERRGFECKAQGCETGVSGSAPGFLLRPPYSRTRKLFALMRTPCGTLRGGPCANPGLGRAILTTASARTSTAAKTTTARTTTATKTMRTVAAPANSMPRPRRLCFAKCLRNLGENARACGQPARSVNISTQSTLVVEKGAMRSLC